MPRVDRISVPDFGCRSLMRMPKPDSVRFTFLCDRFNRTAIASLLAALEDVVENPDTCLRVARLEGADGVDFNPSFIMTEILCFSSMTVNAGIVMDTHGRLRERWGDAFVSVCGGSHASGDPEDLLRSGIDYCCVGEGEEVIREIHRQALEKGSLDGIAGLFHLDGGRVVGGRRGEVDIEDWGPLPVRVRFPTYIEIGRGCRWACSYCQTPLIHGARERFRSPPRVEEVVRRYAASGMKDFRFLLPNALGYMSDSPGVPNPEALEEVLARSSKACGGGRVFLGSFPSEIRPDYVTESGLRVLRRCVSNSGLVIGGQSGSQRMLDVVHRGHSVEDIKRACQMGLACGFEVSVDLMLGFPGERVEDRRATFDLVEEMGAAGVVSNMHFFVPLPGTRMMSARPVFLSARERRRLDTYAQKGILRGGWRRQEQTAWILAGK